MNTFRGSGRSVVEITTKIWMNGNTIPDNGGILIGNTVRFYGYSLSYGNIEMLKVHDLTTNNNMNMKYRL